MMYSNKQNVNILTSLLVGHGVTHAVVCPGSRNAPIVHNLYECPAIECHPVTDERSAAFYALGMAQALNAPVALCVTSGSALLNTAPAVAEAWYQHQPLIVISADRPQQWIDQLDGQTLPQPGVFGQTVRTSVTLPEADAWHCNRLVNEALLSATSPDPRPVHINVPITEPLFTFDTPQLPDERLIVRISPTTDYDGLPLELVDGLCQARRPIIVFGQANVNNFECTGTDFLFSHVIVLHEALAPFPSVSHFDEVLCQGGIELPDFILHIGDTIVSKRLRLFLRQATEAHTWRISPSGLVEDTFMNLRGIIVGDPAFVLQSLSTKMSYHKKTPGMAYRRQWLKALTEASQHAQAYTPPYSQMAAVKRFEEMIAKYYPLRKEQDETLEGDAHIHYANSSAIRLANIYARHPVWCNRGVNGIEGSLSTAAGFSIVAKQQDQPTFCVIGDLSFFYDQNALWNQELGGNLRILLLNNGGGGIFSQLKGLADSPAHHLVAGTHHTSAEGICRQNNVGYLHANDMEQLHKGIEQLITMKSQRPVLLEVFTDSQDDLQAYNSYYKLR